MLIPQHSTFGIPHMEIVDADFRGRGELLLEHRHEGIGLDAEYACGTLAQVASLWGKPCTAETIKGRDADAPPLVHRAPRRPQPRSTRRCRHSGRC